MGQAQRLGRPRGRRAVHHGGDRAGQGVGAVAVEGLGRLPLPRSPPKAGAPEPVTLLYPEWLPGNHGPRGPINSIAGLRITANGRPVEWRRDSSYVYAFHVDVPEGARSLRVEFQHLSPTDPGQGRVTMTP